MDTTSPKFCSLCRDDDVIRDALKWCLVCDEGICQECEKFHKKTKPLRSHTLIDVVEKRDTPVTNSILSENLAKWSSALRQLKLVIPTTLEDLSTYARSNCSLASADDVSYYIQIIRDKINDYFDKIENQLMENEEEKSMLPSIQLKEFDATYIEGWLGNFAKMDSVTGCTISPDGRIFVAHCNSNCKLSVYDKDGKFLRFMPVSGSPFDVTTIDESRLGVTYHKQCYFEILDSNKDTVEKKVEFKNAIVCLGICCFNDRLYVLAGEEGLVVTDLSGNIVNTIKNTTSQFFQYITATTDRIYIADTWKNELHCFDTEGTPVWMKDDVGHLKGISIDKYGNIFVCDSVSCELRTVHGDGKECKTIMSTELRTNTSPTVVYYSHDRDTLCIGDTSGNVAIYHFV